MWNWNCLVRFRGLDFSGVSLSWKGSLSHVCLAPSFGNLQSRLYLKCGHKYLHVASPVLKISGSFSLTRSYFLSQVPKRQCSNRAMCFPQISYVLPSEAPMYHLCHILIEHVAKASLQSKKDYTQSNNKASFKSSLISYLLVLMTSIG